jgi:hypothetical protein
MKTLKKSLLSVAVGASLLAGGQAYAAAIGTAYLDINNLVVNRTDTNAVLTVGTDIIPTPGTAGILNVGDTRASLTGFADTAQSLSASPITAPPADDVDGAGFSCLGACAYGNNSFTQLTQPNDAVASYVLSDIKIDGAIIGGIPGQNPPGRARAIAESVTIPNDVGSGESNVGVNAEFNFISNVSTDLSFSGDFDVYMRAALLGVDGVTANGSVGWTVALSDNTTNDLFAYNIASDDDWLVGNVSTLVPGADVERDFGGSFGADTIGVKGVGNPFLVAGNQYTLTITHTAVADSEASLVPMPAPLALFGIGALALAGLSRKQVKKA